MEESTEDKTCVNFGGRNLFGDAAKCGGENNTLAAEKYPLGDGSACANTIGEVFSIKLALKVKQSDNKDQGMSEQEDIQVIEKQENHEGHNEQSVQGEQSNAEVQEVETYKFKFDIGVDFIGDQGRLFWI